MRYILLGRRTWLNTYTWYKWYVTSRRIGEIPKFKYTSLSLHVTQRASCRETSVNYASGYIVINTRHTAQVQLTIRVRSCANVSNDEQLYTYVWTELDFIPNMSCCIMICEFMMRSARLATSGCGQFFIIIIIRRRYLIWDFTMQWSRIFQSRLIE